MIFGRFWILKGLTSLVSTNEKANSAYVLFASLSIFSLVCAMMLFLLQWLLVFVVDGYKTTCFITAVANFLCWRVQNYLFYYRCS
jgi:hypothetical protein